MYELKSAALLLALILVACESDPTTPAGTGTALGIETSGHVSGFANGSAHLPAFPPDQCLITNPGCPSPPGLGLRNFTFSATRYRDGSVSGQWQLVAGSAILHGPIDCLTIGPDGHSARISGIVALAKFTLFAEGTAFAMELFDNGPPGNSDADVTTQLRAFRNADPAVGRAFCEDGTIPTGADLDPLPTAHGNVTIHLAE